MDEIWEKAVKTAPDGKTDHATVKTLTLDGAVKCYQGKLPSQNLLEKFKGLEHLSIANVGVSSLERFPRITSLQKLNLSDNRIVGGLEFLVKAGLDSLTDLDLSNNRIRVFEDLAPLAELKLVSLDLYECPVTKIRDYRSRVFGLIKSLRYLDKMDLDGNEVLESDEDGDDEEDEEEGVGCGKVDGEGQLGEKKDNGGVVDDEEEESDADEGVEDDGESAEEDGEDEEENEEEDEEEDEEDQNGEVLVRPSSSSHSKRKISEIDDNVESVDDDGVVDASSL